LDPDFAAPHGERVMNVFTDAPNQTLRRQTIGTPDALWHFVKEKGLVSLVSLDYFLPPKAPVWTNVPKRAR
jgi:hypothetical protein